MPNLISSVSTLVIFSLIFFLLFGCGRYEVPKTEIVEAKGECGEERACTSEKDDSKTKQVESSAEEISDDSENVETSDDEILEKYIFIPKSKSWAKHIETTPEGYELATRSEAIFALEEGLLDDLMDSKASFWTSSEYEGLLEMAWVVSFTSDYGIPKTVALPALFIAK